MNMKYLDDYTKEELHNLTQEDKEHIFAIECAARGVALPSALLEVPGDPANREDLAPDVTVYCVKIGYSSNSPYFKTSQEAQAVADLINASAIKVETTYQSSRSRYYLGSERSDYETASVGSVEAFSQDKWSQLKSEIEAFDKSKKEREHALDENKKIRDSHSKIWGEINDAVEEANYEFNTAARLAKQFDEYKVLANNDESVAKKFLIKAHYNELVRLSLEALATVGISQTELEPTGEAEATPAADKEFNDLFGES